MTFAIAAAGTGGHVFPGLAVGEALMSRGVPRESILYVGGDRLEAEIYPGAGFPFLPVEIRGLQRSMTTRNLTLPRVVWRARDAIEEAIGRRGIEVVLGMGGYVTIPAALATRRARVSLFVAEQNALDSEWFSVLDRDEQRVLVELLARITSQIDASYRRSRSG